MWEGETQYIITGRYVGGGDSVNYHWALCGRGRLSKLSLGVMWGGGRLSKLSLGVMCGGEGLCDWCDPHPGSILEKYICIVRVQFFQLLNQFSSAGW